MAKKILKIQKSKSEKTLKEKPAKKKKSTKKNKVINKIKTVQVPKEKLAIDDKPVEEILKESHFLDHPQDGKEPFTNIPTPLGKSS